MCGEEVREIGDFSHCSLHHTTHTTASFEVIFNDAKDPAFLMVEL